MSEVENAVEDKKVNKKADQELTIMRRIDKILSPIAAGKRQRILSWAVDKYVRQPEPVHTQEAV